MGAKTALKVEWSAQWLNINQMERKELGVNSMYASGDKLNGSVLL